MSRLYLLAETAEWLASWRSAPVPVYARNVSRAAREQRANFDVCARERFPPGITRGEYEKCVLMLEQAAGDAAVELAEYENRCDKEKVAREAARLAEIAEIVARVRAREQKP